MNADLLNALCAIAALFVPLAFAWFVLSRTARRHARRRPPRDRPMR